MIKKYNHLSEYLNILNLLFSNYHISMNVREIARKLNLNVASASVLINEMIDLGLIEYREIGRSKAINLNISNERTIDFLTIAEIYKKINFLDKFPFKKFFDMLESYQGDIIVVFGSYARGDYSENSDLDLLVVSDKKEQLPSFILPIKLHDIHISKESFYEQVKDKNEFINEILRNHIIIRGAEQFVRLIINNYGK